MVYLDVTTWNGKTSRVEFDPDHDTRNSSNLNTELSAVVRDSDIMIKGMDSMVERGEITEIHILEGTEDLVLLDVGVCSHLKVLTFPKDIHISHIWCEDTMIKELNIPLSVKRLICNPNTEITNFDELDKGVDIVMVTFAKSLEQVMRE